MRKFRLKTGYHADLTQRDADGNPKIYKKGQIVHSEKDLCKAQPNKFEEIKDVKAGKAEDDTELANTIPDLVPIDQQNGEETDERETEDREEDETETSTESDAEVEADSSPADDLGVDATEEFPETAGFSVFVKDEKYSITKKGKTDVLRGPLTKKEVIPNLKKLKKAH
jgi:hypothetical protein